MTSSHIRYAKTDAGVSVAFIERGAGRPVLVVENLGLCSITLAQGRVGFVSHLASRRTVISFDFPGTGLSIGGPADMSLDAQVSYMEAIARELGDEPVDVYAWGPSAAPAASFAARCPELVATLVLANPCVDFRLIEVHSPLAGVVEVALADFGLYVKILSSLLGVPGHQQERLREALLQGTPPEVVPHWMQAVRDFDASDDLGDICAPTLVLQASSNPLIDAQHVASIAASIPGAQHVMVESAPLGGMLSDYLDTVVDFMDGKQGELPQGRRITRGPMQVIAFTDLENHTQMMQRLGDAAGRALLREHERLTIESIRRNGGSVVKSQGDGFMAAFDSAQSGLEWAADLQRAFASRDGEPLKIRIGLNAGEPISDQQDFFGTSVIAAARVASQAMGGQILVANVVRELVAGKGFRFAERGVASLKGIDEPVHLYELVWDDAAALG